jgi:hypothetical protein
VHEHRRCRRHRREQRNEFVVEPTPRTIGAPQLHVDGGRPAREVDMAGREVRLLGCGARALHRLHRARRVGPIDVMRHRPEVEPEPVGERRLRVFDERVHRARHGVEFVAVAAHPEICHQADTDM